MEGVLQDVSGFDKTFALFLCLFFTTGEKQYKKTQISAKTIDSIFAEIRAYRHCYKNAVSFSVMQT